jgi:hypothetical protein
MWLKDGLPQTCDAEAYSKYFATLAQEQLYVMYLWFAGCVATLPLLFPNVYEGNGGTADEPDPMAFTKCIHTGAGNKNGTRQQIRMMPLEEFLFKTGYAGNAHKRGLAL